MYMNVVCWAMNRNELQRIAARFFVLLVAILWLAYMIANGYPGVVTNDTMRQLHEGMSGVYTNWKPTLYSWQLGQLERMFPGNGIGVTYVLQMSGFALAVAGVAWIYSRKSLVYAFLVLVLPLFYTVKCMLVTTVGNDEMAAACYLLYIAIVLLLSDMRGRWGRCALTVLSFLVVGYGLVLRHNSFPAVLLLVCWGLWKTGMRGWWKIVSSSVACLLVVLLLNAGVSYHVLKAEASYPLRSPLVDDIVNLSILDGAWHPVVKQFCEGELPPPHQQCVYAPESGNWNSPINPYTLYPTIEERRRDYEILKNAWVDMVSAQPGRYFITKLFFFHQFLLEGRCLPWACDMMKAAFPHISIHMDRASRNWTAWVNREFLAMSLVPLCCYTLICTCVVGRFRRWIAQDPVRIDAIVFMAVAFLYTASFLLLVLSATEQRYYIIRATLCCLGGCLLILSAWLRKAGR